MKLSPQVIVEYNQIFVFDSKIITIFDGYFD